MNQHPFLVSVCMITYNHEKFIQQAIEGVLMQKTTFPIELVIGEDFSTDNTREICKEYKNKFPDKITLLLPEKNLGMIPNFNATLKACSGKYIAMCEGDDYWTDSTKLQQQVDFLNMNPNYSASCHNTIYCDEQSSEKQHVWPWNEDRDFSIRKLSEGNCISTLSLVFRNDKQIISELPSFVEAPVCDYILNLLLAKKGNIRYFSFVGGAYRVHENGVWSTKHNSFEYAISIGTKSVMMFEKLCDYFKKEDKIVRRNFRRQLLANYNKLRIVFAMHGEKSASKHFAILYFINGFFKLLLRLRDIFSIMLNLFFFRDFKKRARY